MTADLHLAFHSSDPVQAVLHPDSQDRLEIRLMRLRGPDGPDYDFEGLLDLNTPPFRISHEFTYRIAELREVDTALRRLLDEPDQVARITTLVGAFEVVVGPVEDGAFPVRVELYLTHPSGPPLVIGGLAIDREGLLARLRQIRGVLGAGGASASEPNQSP
jgi:hypothetical protein